MGAHLDTTPHTHTHANTHTHTHTHTHTNIIALCAWGEGRNAAVVCTQEIGGKDQDKLVLITVAAPWALWCKVYFCPVQLERHNAIVGCAWHPILW